MDLKRIGLLSPPKWFSYCDDELVKVGPENIRVMNAQIRMPRDFRYDLDEITQAPDELLAAAQSLADSDTDFVAQIGTPFAMVHGWDGANDLERKIEGKIGKPFEMMGLSLPRVCREMGIGSVSVCTVFFTEDWTNAYRKFLENTGLKVLFIGSFSELDILDQVTMLESCQGHDICTKQTMIDTVARCCERAPDAEAVLLAGLPCPQLDMLDELEAQAGKPVISYPALYSRILKRLSLSAKPGFGSMFN